MNEPRQQLIEETIGRVDQILGRRRRQFCAMPLFRGMSMVQVYLLMVLRESGPRTVSELASLLQVAAPSASAIVDRMEEHELVHRVRDSVDRRVVHVEIAEHGRAVVEQLSGVRQEEMRGVLQVMTDDELSSVVQGLRSLEAAVQRMEDSRSPAHLGHNVA